MTKRTAMDAAHAEALERHRQVELQPVARLSFHLAKVIDTRLAIAKRDEPRALAALVAYARSQRTPLWREIANCGSIDACFQALGCALERDRSGTINGLQQGGDEFAFVLLEQLGGIVKEGSRVVLLDQDGRLHEARFSDGALGYYQEQEPRTARETGFQSSLVASLDAAGFLVDAKASKRAGIILRCKLERLEVRVGLVGSAYRHQVSIHLTSAKPWGDFELVVPAKLGAERIAAAVRALTERVSLKTWERDYRALRKALPGAEVVSEGGVLHEP